MEEYRASHPQPESQEPAQQPSNEQSRAFESPAEGAPYRALPESIDRVVDAAKGETSTSAVSALSESSLVQAIRSVHRAHRVRREKHTHSPRR